MSAVPVQLLMLTAVYPLTSGTPHTLMHTMLSADEVACLPRCSLPACHSYCHHTQGSSVTLSLEMKQYRCNEDIHFLLKEVQDCSLQGKQCWLCMRRHGMSSFYCWCIGNSECRTLLHNCSTWRMSSGWNTLTCSQIKWSPMTTHPAPVT
jgi:hypothetical protein